MFREKGMVKDVDICAETTKMFKKFIDKRKLLTI